ATEKELRSLGQQGNPCPRDADSLYCFITGVDLRTVEESKRHREKVAALAKAGPMGEKEREQVKLEVEQFFKEVMGVDRERFTNNHFICGFFDGVREVWDAIKYELDRPSSR